jgi:hypothetical protein
MSQSSSYTATPAITFDVEDTSKSIKKRPLRLRHKKQLKGGGKPRGMFYYVKFLSKLKILR